MLEITALFLYGLWVSAMEEVLLPFAAGIAGGIWMLYELGQLIQTV